MPARFYCDRCDGNRNLMGAAGTPRQMPCGHCCECCSPTACASGRPQPPAQAIPVKIPTPHSHFSAPQIPEIQCDNCKLIIRDHRQHACPRCGMSPQRGERLVRGVKLQGPTATGATIPVAYLPSKTQLKLNPSPRLIGLEIEIDNYKYGADIDKAVRALNGANESDGTAGSGLEINTAPAGGDLFYKNTRELSEKLREAGAKCGVKWGRSGLHCHVDARDASYADLRKIMILYAKVEPALYSIIDPKRAAYGAMEPGTNFCRPLGMGVINALRDPATAKTDVVNLVCDAQWMKANKGARPGKAPPGGHRYKGLNMWSWWIRGTLEFRMHHGTTQWQKMVPWGMALCGIVDNGYRLTEQQVQDWPIGKKGLMMLAPDTSLEFCDTTMIMDNNAAGKMLWDPDKDGVRQWIQKRWEYFAGKRKNKDQPILPVIEY